MFVATDTPVASSVGEVEATVIASAFPNVVKDHVYGALIETPLESVTDADIVAV